MIHTEPSFLCGVCDDGRTQRIPMSRIKKLITLIREREYRQIWVKGKAFLSQRVYLFFAVRRDKRYGGVSVNRSIPSKHQDLGAYATQSSDYRCLKRLFREVPLRPDDVFADVGCGEGRVLTYLYDEGFRGREIGIELDADAAETAKRRAASCPNVTIICGNVLELGELLKEVSAVYLFNPFNRTVFRAFVRLLETVCTKPVRMYYLNCLYVSEAESSGRWTCLSKGEIRRGGCRPMGYTVHELRISGD